MKQGFLPVEEESLIGTRILYCRREISFCKKDSSLYRTEGSLIGTRILHCRTEGSPFETRIPHCIERRDPLLKNGWICDLKVHQQVAAGAVDVATVTL